MSSQRPTWQATGTTRRPVCSAIVRAAVVAGLELAAGDHHVGAGARERTGHLEAEAAAAARDHGNLAAERAGRRLEIAQLRSPRPVRRGSAASRRGTRAVASRLPAGAVSSAAAAVTSQLSEVGERVGVALLGELP